MFIRLSYNLDENTPSYGGKNTFNSKPLSKIENGDSANTTKWELFNHLGTHIDFPYHFYQNGQTIEYFSDDFWNFTEENVQILKVNIDENNYLIKPKNLIYDKLNYDTEFLILKTGYGVFRSEEKYWKYNPGLNVDCIKWIKKNYKKLRILGLDSISISSWQHRDVGRIVHKELLNPKNPILIIEDMNLSRINLDTKIQYINIAPLFVSRSDGSPCTIIAEVKN